MHPSSSAILGYILILFAALGFGSIGAISRYPMAEGVSAMECAFWRAAFGSLFFCIHGAVSGAWRVTPKQRFAFSLYGIPCVGLLFFVYMYGVQEAGAAATSVLANTAPVWITVWAYFVFKEAMTGSKALSIVLAIAGAGCIVVSGGGLPEKASLLGFAAGAACGFLFSLHALVGKFYMNANISPVSIYMHMLPVGAACLLPFVNFMPDKSLSAWACLAVMGFMSNWVAYLAFCGALRRLPATRVSVCQTASEPFLAAMLAFWWWGEIFRPVGWLGVVLVVVAVIIVLLSKERKRAVKP